MDGQLMDGWLGGWVDDGWMVGWLFSLDERMDGWMDGSGRDESLRPHQDMGGSFIQTACLLVLS